MCMICNSLNKTLISLNMINDAKYLFYKHVFLFLVLFLFLFFVLFSEGKGVLVCFFLSFFVLLCFVFAS